MKEQFLFVGVGQGGCNVVNELYKKQYLCLFINSSKHDLMTIDASNKYKFHIPSAKGCVHDRSKGLDLGDEYKGYIIDEVINSKFPLQDMIYFVFSMGGGTGSGMTPCMLHMMAHKFPKKHFGIIAIVPSEHESPHLQGNAVDCYKELQKVFDKNPNFKSWILLDNHNHDMLRLNRQFADMFDRLLTKVTIPHIKGIIDEEEVVTSLQQKGMITMGTVKYGQSILEALGKDSIFLSFKEGLSCRTIIKSLKDEKSFPLQMTIEATVGIPEDVFTGYNDTDNFIAITGMPIVACHKRFAKLSANRYKHQVSMEEERTAVKEENLQLQDEKVNKDIIENPMKNTIDEVAPVVEDDDEVVTDYDSLFNEFRKKIRSK